MNCVSNKTQLQLIRNFWHIYDHSFMQTFISFQSIEYYLNIIIIESNNLNSPEFTLDMDKDITDRIRCGLNIKSFSANDFWFHTVT